MHALQQGRAGCLAARRRWLAGGASNRCCCCRRRGAHVAWHAGFKNFYPKGSRPGGVKRAAAGARQQLGGSAQTRAGSCGSALAGAASRAAAAAAAAPARQQQQQQLLCTVVMQTPAAAREQPAYCSACPAHCVVLSLQADGPKPEQESGGGSSGGGGQMPELNVNANMLLALTLMGAYMVYQVCWRLCCSCVGFVARVKTGQRCVPGCAVEVPCWRSRGCCCPAAAAAAATPPAPPALRRPACTARHTHQTLASPGPRPTEISFQEFKTQLLAKGQVGGLLMHAPAQRLLGCRSSC